MSKQNEPKIKCEIISHIGTVEDKTKEWKFEFNLISWGGYEPKYDIRKWSPDHSKMSKGITLTENEFRSLYKIMGEEIKNLDDD